MQIYLRDLLEREYRAESNRRVFDGSAQHQSHVLDVEDVVSCIRTGRGNDP